MEKDYKVNKYLYPFSREYILLVYICTYGFLLTYSLIENVLFFIINILLFYIVLSVLNRKKKITLKSVYFLFIPIGIIFIFPLYYNAWGIDLYISSSFLFVFLLINPLLHFEIENHKKYFLVIAGILFIIYIYFFPFSNQIISNKWSILITTFLMFILSLIIIHTIITFLYTNEKCKTNLSYHLYSTINQNKMLDYNQKLLSNKLLKLKDEIETTKAKIQSNKKINILEKKFIEHTLSFQEKVELLLKHVCQNNNGLVSSLMLYDTANNSFKKVASYAKDQKNSSQINDFNHSNLLHILNENKMNIISISNEESTLIKSFLGQSYAGKTIFYPIKTNHTQAIIEISYFSNRNVKKITPNARLHNLFFELLEQYYLKNKEEKLLLLMKQRELKIRQSIEKSKEK